MNHQISDIMNDMSEVLDIVKMKKLQEVLIARLSVVHTSGKGSKRHKSRRTGKFEY